MSRFKIFYFILLSVVTSGCFSVGQYHLGYHNLGSDNYMYGAVGKEYVQPLENFEISCIERIVNYRFDELYDDFGPKLKKEMTVEQLKNLNTNLKNRYEYNGEYERILLVNQKTMLDEGVGKDAFKFYDFVGTSYLLKGKIKSVVTLYLYKINNDIKIIGFESMDYEGNEKEIDIHWIRHICPETLDNARLIGRSYKKVS